MRYSLLATLLVVSGASIALAQDAAQPAPTPALKIDTTPKHTVRLNNLVLEELKQANPRHYTEAQRVIAAASELCAPGSAEVWKVLRMPPGHCAGEFLKTSNPPKREISFQLDDTRYIALVTVKDAGPEFHRAVEDDRPAMVSPNR
jgi:hypothetical protein